MVSELTRLHLSCIKIKCRDHIPLRHTNLLLSSSMISSYNASLTAGEINSNHYLKTYMNQRVSVAFNSTSQLSECVSNARIVEMISRK